MQITKKQLKHLVAGKIATRENISRWVQIVHDVHDGRLPSVGDNTSMIEHLLNHMTPAWYSKALADMPEEVCALCQFDN